MKQSPPSMPCKFPPLLTVWSQPFHGAMAKLSYLVLCADHNLLDWLAPQPDILQASHHAVLSWPMSHH